MLTLHSSSLRTARCVVLATTLMGSHWFTWAQTDAVLLGEGPYAVTTADILAESRPLNATARASVLANPSSVQRMAADIYLRRRLAALALEQKIDQQPEVQRTIQIVRERIFADALMRQSDTQSRPSEAVLEKLASQIYQATPQRFEQPESLHLRHILLPASAADARERAQALRQQLQEGADFEALARENSKDPGSASKGGDLGFVTKGKMVPPFEDAAFALDTPGALSPVVETQFGFHIIELVAKRPAGLQPFAEVKEQLEQEAANNAAKAARQDVARPILEAAIPHTDAIEAFSASQRK